jgi:hypothetical protein
LIIEGLACFVILVRDQEVGGSNPLAPTNAFNSLRASDSKTAQPFTHPLGFASFIEGAYTAAMADNAVMVLDSAFQPGTNVSPLGEPIDFDVRRVGPGMRDRSRRLAQNWIAG